MRELLEWQSTSMARDLFSLPLRDPVKFFMRWSKNFTSCSIGAGLTPCIFSITIDKLLVWKEIKISHYPEPK